MERCKLPNPNRRRPFLSALLLSPVLLTGCTQPTAPSDRQIRQQAAEDAHQVRHDLRDAGQETKQALLQARRETQDMIAGARAGWKEGTPRDRTGVDTGTGRVDINHASVHDLETLPGVGREAALRIATHRPYADADALVKRGIVSKDEWERLRDQVTAR